MTQMARLYIAGAGMITPIGCNPAMNHAMLDAGISGYKMAEYHNSKFQQTKFAEIPGDLIAQLKLPAGIESPKTLAQEHMLKMALFSMAQVTGSAAELIPLILACPEKLPGFHEYSNASWLINSLAQAMPRTISTKHSQLFYSGRAGGIEAIDFVFRHLKKSSYDYVLIGGSDCCWDYQHLDGIDKMERLLAVESLDGYVPGEGAGFLLLTPNAALAQVRQGKIIALHPPAMAVEPGHLFSDEPYRGDGLNEAFKGALEGLTNHKIHSIYSSMNGERYWAKELGVAQLRNRRCLSENVLIQHPAEGYGELGAATAPVLIGLAAEHLHNTREAHADLVYCSADTGLRGAIVMEKLPQVEPC